MSRHDRYRAPGTEQRRSDTAVAGRAEANFAGQSAAAHAGQQSSVNDNGLVVLLRLQLAAALVDHDVGARLSGLIQAANEFRTRLQHCRGDLGERSADVAEEILQRL